MALIPLPMLMNRARDLWCTLAGAQVAFPPAGVAVVVSPHSLLCPPGWSGVISLGPSAIATVPDPALVGPVSAALQHLPAPEMTDPRQVRAALPITEILGPAVLAYTDESLFSPPGAVSLSATPLSSAPPPSAPPLAAPPPSAPALAAAPLSADSASAASFSASSVAADDPGLAALLSKASKDDAGESGLDEITSAAQIIRRGDEVVAAAGWQRWPTGVAHVSVLTAPDHRGRGLAHAVAGRAVADALGAGLLPQWRARPLASRRVARALGFRELGSQLSFRLTD